MDERTKWLMKQPTFWLGIAVSIAATGIAAGLYSIMVARYAAAFIAICATYGIGAGHLKSPPRVDLADMSTAEREQIFKAHPEVRARWELRQAIVRSEQFTPPPMPPPLPSPTEDPKK